MKFTIAAMAVAGLYLFGAQTAPAEPMKCSGEQKTCAAKCAAIPNRVAAANCTLACQTSQKACMRTGCWDNGGHRYCGLMKQ